MNPWTGFFLVLSIVLIVVLALTLLILIPLRSERHKFAGWLYDIYMLSTDAIHERLRMGKKPTEPLDTIYIPFGAYLTLWNIALLAIDCDEEHLKHLIKTMDGQRCLGAEGVADHELK